MVVVGGSGEGWGGGGGRGGDLELLTFVLLDVLAETKSLEVRRRGLSGGRGVGDGGQLIELRAFSPGFSFRTYWLCLNRRS